MLPTAETMKFGSLGEEFHALCIRISACRKSWWAIFVAFPTKEKLLFDDPYKSILKSLWVQKYDKSLIDSLFHLLII